MRLLEAEAYMTNPPRPLRQSTAAKQLRQGLGWTWDAVLDGFGRARTGPRRGGPRRAADAGTGPVARCDSRGTLAPRGVPRGSGRRRVPVQRARVQRRSHHTDRDHRPFHRVPPRGRADGAARAVRHARAAAPGGLRRAAVRRRGAIRAAAQRGDLSGGHVAVAAGRQRRPRRGHGPTARWTCARRC